MGYSPLFVVGQTDTLPPITASLTDTNGTVVNLTAATSVSFAMSNFLAGVTVRGTATVVNAATGSVSYSWKPGDLATPGVYCVEWAVTWTGGGTTTYPQHGYDFVTVMNDLAMGYPNVTPTFNTIWSSTSAPVSANGSNGDFWYNTATGYFYGPKANGTWPAGFLLNPSLIPLNQIAAPIGSVNMNSQKLTNLLYGTAKTDSAAFGQIPNVGVDATSPTYGADPTGTVDSTAAIQAAASAVSAAGGGKVLLQAGKYLLSGTNPLQLNSMTNVIIEGVGGFNPGASTTAGTYFYYQGAAAADAVQIINSTGITIRNIGFAGVSSSWTGNYINCATSGDTTRNLLIENCEFVNTVTTAATDINLENSQTVRITNCAFINGATGIVGSSATLTSAEVDITDCYFSGMTAAITNPSVSWNIQNSYFNATGITHAASVPSTALLVNGCEFAGSMTVGIQAYGNNISIIGNTITGTTGINIDTASTGLVVKSNTIQNCTTGISTTDTVGVDISNNDFNTCTTATSYNSTSTNLVTNGSFSNGTTGWSSTGSATLAQITTDSVGGTGECMTVTTNGSVLGGTNATTFVGTANTVYQCSAWIKRVSGTGEPVLTIKDTTNNITGNSTVLNTTGTWTRLTCTITTGASTPTIQVSAATTVNTTATAFNIDLVTARKGTVLLPEQFYLHYTGNSYVSCTNTITGNYTQCGLVEDPVGTVAYYGSVEISAVLYQAAGYDAVLGNNLYVPGTTSLTGALTVNAATSIAPTSTTAVPLTANIPASSTADVADFNVNGTNAWKINSSGNLSGTKPFSVAPTSTSVVPITANSPTGTTVDVADFSINGVTAWKVTSTGTLSGTQPLSVAPTSTTAVPATFNTPASSTADVADFEQNGTAVLSINSSGNTVIKNSKQLDLTSANSSPFLGNAWTTYAVSWTNSAGTNPAIGNGTITARYQKYGRMVAYNVAIVGGSTTTWGTGGTDFWKFSVPFTPFNTATGNWCGSGMIFVTGSQFYAIDAVVYANGGTGAYVYILTADAATIGLWDQVGAGAYGFTTNSNISFTVVYESTT